MAAATAARSGSARRVAAARAWKAEAEAIARPRLGPALATARTRLGAPMAIARPPLYAAVAIARPRLSAGAALAQPRLSAAAAAMVVAGRSVGATARVVLAAAMAAAAVAVPATLARVPAIPRIGARGIRRIAIVGLPFAAYLALGLLFSIGGGIITGDAWSRVGNGYYMLFSRDPHLAAIGFVWNPLPSIVDAVLLPLAAIWRPIVSYGVAGNLMSAAFMTLAAREVWLWLGDLQTSRPVRIGLIAAFALHPLIALYGGNGMSEAPFLFFLLVAGRNVSTWVRTGEVSRLAVAGFGLAFAYLTRYEAVAPIAALTLVTAGIAFARTGGSWRQRSMTGLADALIVAAPAAGAFALWALASWLIVGSPFDTFTSVYGGSSQIALSIEAIRASTGSTPAAAMGYLTEQILGLEPALLVVLGLGAAVAVLRRDVRVLIPLAAFGSLVVFSGLLFIAGGSFGWLRFSIPVVPLVVMVLGMALARDGRSVAALTLTPLGRRIASLVQPARSAVGAMSAAVLVGLALVAVPVSMNAIFDARLAREEAPRIAGLITGNRMMPGEHRQFLVAGDVARYLDAQHLPNGSVVVDVALGFWIVLQSENPKQFVITPDRDFERIVADPEAFGAKYLLAPPTGGLGGLQALERAHPGLYATGAGLAELVRTFGDEQQGVAWRLYEVTSTGL